ncbi:MAG: response regulator transcription factor [Anaerovoracaceae bacterium]|nr:response regulator transcription factor [Bacillota bacterium]MEE0517854.1 response regulator transcription factor [Anaerovoracaceae bacterium]
MRILVCEDQRDLNKITVKHLTAEGYSVDSCYDGEEALAFIDMAEYDAVVLDIMMPKKDGISVLKEMRSAGNNTPVIFLTAKDSIEDRVSGLDSGANDYLIKPFSFDELLARIRAMTRKSSGNLSNIFTAADLTLDTSAHTVYRAGKEITLSAKEFSLLEYLLRNKGRVLTRDIIENNIWNFDYEGGTNAVDVYIRYLRKKIDDAFEPKLIHTVRGSGYVLKEK